MSSFLDHLLKRSLLHRAPVLDLTICLVTCLTILMLIDPVAAGASIVGLTICLAWIVTRGTARVRALLADAYTDPLTGLPTRAVAEYLLHRIDASGAPWTVAFADADGLKRVNEIHGHPVGDRYLTVVAHRLRSAVGATGTVVRLGGDEFAVFTTSTAEALADAIDAAMATARMTEHGLHPQASIGIATTRGTSGPPAGYSSYPAIVDRQRLVSPLQLLPTGLDCAY